MRPPAHRYDTIENLQGAIMAFADIHVFRYLSDNCGTLIRDTDTGAVACIDVADADAVAREAGQKGWKITDILITHEHADHTQGVAALAAATGAKVTGPQAAKADGVPVDRVVGEGDRVTVGKLAFDVWATPGHCPGHLTYVCPQIKVALVGDVVFPMGCGRIISGNAGQLWASVSRIAALPADTLLITGHDYTLANARFALAMEPANAALVARVAQAEQRSKAGDFWATTTVGEEHATNPFFRAGEAALAKAAGKPGAPADAVFAALREAKNSFRG